jgi:uncharacterized protein
MKLSLDTGGGTHMIRAYERGKILVNDQVIGESVIVLPDQLIRDWPPQSMEELRVEHIELLALLEVEIVLLGTGTRQQFPKPELLRPTLERRIGLEVMDTAAACRTFNILSAEGRRAAAALMMI